MNSAFHNVADEHNFAARPVLNSQIEIQIQARCLPSAPATGPPMTFVSETALSCLLLCLSFSMKAFSLFLVGGSLCIKAQDVFGTLSRTIRPNAILKIHAMRYIIWRRPLLPQRSSRTQSAPHPKRTHTGGGAYVTGLIVRIRCRDLSIISLIDRHTDKLRRTHTLQRWECCVSSPSSQCVHVQR